MLGFIEIVKGLGANNVLSETFFVDRNVFFWNHILNLGLGAGLGWAGLGWLGWGLGWGSPETEIGLFENGNVVSRPKI